MTFSRRDMLRYATLGSGVALISALGAPGLAQGRPVLGTIIDYSAAVPSPSSIRAAGHIGAIRYVSDARPDAAWMRAKPLTGREADALVDSGLEVVSCYQYGKAETADWLGGYEAGLKHARRGLDLHYAAGGPENRPIYASIDDNPTFEQFTLQVVPYLLGWQEVVGAGNLGVYANSPTIDWASAVSLGSFYWQHDWGTPKGYVHPRANLHQIPGEVRIDGIGVDINHVLTPDYGQWSLAGSAPSSAPGLLGS
ncbi:MULTISPECIES: DUF1906 domain-containing protein [Rhodococcus]|uniref:DUF1906 domain-containing protein n=1 Tax=Rhodococcus rhodochrous TaxID=1829 RepID=A0AAW4XG30_RHORH|nr:DUF1906 domain-containing protein [Rhodococcus rhodochrous]MCD2112042.1 DUF1906 domain-containing protein [Rhodococcus rhodochrous]